MMTQKPSTEVVEREARSRHLLELIDEVQERLILIRHQAEHLTKIAQESTNGVSDA